MRHEISLRENGPLKLFRVQFIRSHKIVLVGPISVRCRVGHGPVSLSLVESPGRRPALPPSLLFFFFLGSRGGLCLFASAPWPLALLRSALFIRSIFTLFPRWPCVWGRRNADAREPRQIGGGGRQTRQNPRKEEEERVSRGVDVPVMRGLTAVGRCPGRPPMHRRRRPLPRCRTDRCRRKRPRPLGALSSRRAADRRARA